MEKKTEATIQGLGLIDRVIGVIRVLLLHQNRVPKGPVKTTVLVIGCSMGFHVSL